MKFVARRVSARGRRQTRAEGEARAGVRSALWLDRGLVHGLSSISYGFAPVRSASGAPGRRRGRCRRRNVERADGEPAGTRTAQAAGRLLVLELGARPVRGSDCESVRAAAAALGPPVQRRDAECPGRWRLRLSLGSRKLPRRLRVRSGRVVHLDLQRRVASGMPFLLSCRLSGAEVVWRVSSAAIPSSTLCERDLRRRGSCAPILATVRYPCEVPVVYLLNREDRIEVQRPATGADAGFEGQAARARRLSWTSLTWLGLK